MNIVQTVKEIPALEIVTPKKEAQRLFLRGIEKHESFNRTMKQLRRDAIEAGFYFLRARAAFDHGEWGEFLSLNSDKISDRTVRFYMQLAEQASQWVRYKNPTLKDLDAVKEQAIAMVIFSPVPLVNLCRDLGHMMKFGEYFADDYEEKKKKRLGDSSAGQLDFDFAKVMAPLDVLCHFGDENYNFNYPEGVDTVAYMTEVETKLEAALTRVRQIKQHGRVIET